jgi:hypothetical protein
MLLEQAWKSGGTFLQGFLGKSGGLSGASDGSQAAIANAGGPDSLGGEIASIAGSSGGIYAQGAAFNARGAITMMAQGGGGIA